MPAQAAAKTDILWGISQACDTDISNPQDSINGPQAGFDGKTAACALGTGVENPAWTVDRFERFQPEKFAEARLEIGFYVAGWNGQDSLAIQASIDGGKKWVDLEKYDRSHPAPGKLTYQEVEASDLFRSPKHLRKAQVRLVYLGTRQGETGLLVYLDGMRLVVTGEEIVPTATPTGTATGTATGTPTTIPTGFPTEPVATQPEGIELTASPTAGTPQATAIGEATSTPTAPTARITVTATLPITAPTTLVPDFRPTVMVTSTVTVTPTAVPTARPVFDDVSGDQVLWLVEQNCNFSIAGPENSLDQNFNDRAASCSGEFAGKQVAWQFLAFQHTSLTHIDASRLELRLSISGWVDDRLDLEFSNGGGWQPLAQFDPAHAIPPAELTTLTYDVSQHLRSPVEVNQVMVRLLGVQANQAADPLTINLDEVRLVVSGGQASKQAVSPIATPSNLVQAVSAASAGENPHADRSLTADGCAACHRAHSGQGNLLRDSWPEEAVCFACHSSAGPGTSVQPAFANHPNTATAYFSHPVSSTNGAHQLGEASSGSFGGGNRHIECEDCHEPHDTVRGSAAAPALPAEMTGMSGVDPVWSGPGGPSSYTWLNSATREYQVCFKCHSSFTALPGYAPDGWNGTAYVANGLRKLTSGNAGQVLDSRDLAREFNPYQASFHPLAAPGRNTAMPADSFVNGWNQGSLVYCSDCHTNADPGAGGIGPHGSPRLHLLGGGSNYSTVMQNGVPRVPPTQICFNCHNYATYVTEENQSTNFRFHKKHMENDWGTTCYTCHDSHGSEQLHLINFDTSVVTILDGRDSQTAWYYDPVTQKAGCFVSCHGKSHDPFEYTP